MGTDKHLQLRASPNSALGMTIAYIQNLPTNNQELAGGTLRGRFLPFAIPQDHPQFREIAIGCATELEAWARAIREYAQLAAPSPSLSTMDLSRLAHHDSYSDYVDGDEEVDEIDEIDDDESEIEDPETESRKRRRREGSLGI